LIESPVLWKESGDIPHPEQVGLLSADGQRAAAGKTDVFLIRLRIQKVWSGRTIGFFRGCKITC
jgi:hypothetical protein